MKLLLKILAFAIIAVCCSSCITSKDTNLLQDIERDYGVIPPPEEYRIIPGDILNIVVYVFDDLETEELFRGFAPSQVDTREGNLDFYANYGVGQGGGSTEEGTRHSTPISVYADGTINFPHLGRIYVQDLTLLEARNLISERLKYVSANASANVTLRNNFFSVIGEAGARRIEMRSNKMTIIQALSTAGPLSDYSVRSKVSIIRQTKDGSVIKTFDLRSKDILNTEYYYIQPNDVIYFPQSKGKFFGATNSFIGVFGLVTSFVGIVIMAFRLF